MPRLGYVIMWVPDVSAAVAFYARAFGLECTRRQAHHGDRDWAELDAGGAAIAFANLKEGEEILPQGFHRLLPDKPPMAIMISLIVDDVAAAHRRAVAAGCADIALPRQEPWGQTIARVRDLNGALVSLASPPPAT